MAETRAEDQTALRAQIQPPTFAQLYSPTGINAKQLCTRLLYTEQYRTECAANNPGDQSRPRSKRVDLMQTSSGSFSSHVSSGVRLPRQQKLTPAEAHSSKRSALPKKAPPGGKNVCARATTGPDDRRRGHRNEPRVTLKLKLKLTSS